MRVSFDKRMIPKYHTARSEWRSSQSSPGMLRDHKGCKLSPDPLKEYRFYPSICAGKGSSIQRSQRTSSAIIRENLSLFVHAVTKISKVYISVRNLQLEKMISQVKWYWFARKISLVYLHSMTFLKYLATYTYTSPVTQIKEKNSHLTNLLLI